MTQPVDGSAPDSLSSRLRLYAEFGRKRGGLLYVLQAAIIAGEYFVIAAVANLPATLWRPVLLMPLFLAYFLVRTPVWRRFYRQQGDLDRVIDRAEARSQLRFALPFSAGLGFLLALSRGPIFGLASSIYLTLPFAAVALWGRLPIDSFLCSFTGIMGHSLLMRPASTTSTAFLLFLAALAVAAYGLYEHWLFLRTYRTGAQIP